MHSPGQPSDEPSPTISDTDVDIGHHRLRVRTIRVALPEADERPTLVFLHDSLGCISVWRDFPQQLCATVGYHGLVYDRHGYGASSPFPDTPRQPDYLEDEAHTLEQLCAHLLDSRANTQAVLFGHSDGGTIALMAAALYPERVRTVVTEGAHVFVEEITLAGIRAARELLRTSDLRDRLWRHHGERTDGVTSAWIDVWLSPSFRDWNIEALLSHIVCPTLVLQGVDDEFGSEAQVRAIVAGISGGAGAAVHSRLIPDARHTPHREAPQAVLSLVHAFLRSAPGDLAGVLPVT
jgi:pimeloyl-ACP methyl ester carboxylesterase